MIWRLLGIASLGWVIGQLTTAEISAVTVLTAVGGLLCLIVGELPRPVTGRAPRPPTQATRAGLIVAATFSFLGFLVIAGLALAVWLAPTRQLGGGGEAHTVDAWTVGPAQISFRTARSWVDAGETRASFGEDEWMFLQNGMQWFVEHGERRRR